MKKLSLIVAGVAALTAASAVQAGTLEDVRAKGFIQCGVSQGLPGFSNPDVALVHESRRRGPVGPSVGLCMDEDAAVDAGST